MAAHSDCQAAAMNQQLSLHGVALNVRSPESLATFYRSRLGMDVVRTASEYRVFYAGRGGYVALRQSSSERTYLHSRDDRYWKIGITAPNLHLARQKLMSQGVEVSEPRQFRDIGYLCHVVDPEGYQIELLQHTFEGQPLTDPGDADLPLGGGAAIAHITLRTADIAADLQHCQQELGMKLLSVQPVPQNGFDLYFLAFTNESPPDPDLQAVENRPWLWQRQYPVLEFQHWHQASTTSFEEGPFEVGYAGLVIGPAGDAS